MAHIPTPRLMQLPGMLLLLAALSWLLLSGQDNPEPSTAKDLLRQARQQQKEGNQETAYSLLRRTQAAALGTDELATWATATQLIGTQQSQQMDFSQAAQTLDSVIALAGRLDSLHPAIFFARREKANLDLAKNQLEQALDGYQRLSEDCERLLPAQDSLLGVSYDALGQVYFYFGEFERALSYVNRAADIYTLTLRPNHPYRGSNENAQGIMHMYLGRLEEALQHFVRSSEIFEHNLGPSHPQVISVKTNIGVLYGELGLFWEAAAVHRDNLPYLDSLPTQAHLNGLLNLGATLTAVGDYEEALRYLDAAEAFLKQYEGMTPENYAYINLHRSAIYQELGQSAQALSQIRAAIRQNQALYGPDHSSLITDFLQLGSLMLHYQHYDSALIAFEKVREIALRRVGPRSLRLGHAWHFTGDTHLEQGNLRQAQESYEAASEVYARIGNRFDHAKSRLGLAAVWRQRADEAATMAEHQQAWALLLPDKPFRLAPEASVLGDWRNHALSEMLHAQGESLHQFGLARQESDYLEAAWACFETSLAVIDSQRHYYEAPSSRRTRVRDQLPGYESALAVALALSDRGKSEYGPRAFLLAEKSKAGTLRDHLRGMQALAFAGVSDSLIQQEHYLRQRMAAVDAAVFEPERDSASLAQLQEEGRSLHQAYQRWLRNLEQAYPRYYQLKYARPLSFSSLEAQLQPGQTLFSYFWGEHQLFGFRVAGGQLSFFDINADSSFRHSLSQWLGFVSHPPVFGREPAQEQQQAGFVLQEMLLPGLSSTHQGLIILPHGRLSYLPFESLLQSAPTGSYRDWNFLAQSHTVNYAYAAELWLQANQGAAATGSEYLGFAPDFSGEALADARAELKPLAFNQSEVMAVANLLQGRALPGDAAQEARLKGLPARPYILHFATHALVDAADQALGRLFFAPDSSQEEDGILHVSEIYGLDLNSPLTVLSACQTGQGPYEAGEGIMSLARAFQYAGSRRVLTTLWQVDDRAGADLTEAFFGHLAQGMPVEQSLHQARRQWLDQSDHYHCHPYFWSGYVLIGPGGIIPLGPAALSWLWLLGGVLLLGLAIWAWRRQA